MSGFSRLTKIGLLVFVMGLILLFPARVAYRWIAPPEFIASGISGSVWSGRAAEVSVSGLYFRELHWRFRPFDLFTAKLAYAIRSQLAPGSIEANIAVGFGGTLRATDLQASLPLASLQSVAPMPGIQGSVNANFSELRVEANVPVAADGVLEIGGLTIPLVSRDPLGGFRAEFFSQESGITASIEDTNAVLEVAGSLQLSPDGSYELRAQLGATGDTPAPVREQLQFLGPANDRGQHELRFEGRL